MIALQLQIALLVSQIKQVRAELATENPAYVQMVDWTPLEIATREIPVVANELPQ
jgi:hypothetical protein